MTFVCLDDAMSSHPKVVRLGDGAFRLHISGILYCNRYLTDGEIPAAIPKTLTPNYSRSHLTELVRAGVWEKSEDGYVVRDYLQWNRSRAQVEAVREAKRRAGAKGAKERWGR